MRIAVNTRLLIPNKLDGIGWFTHEVLQRLVKMRPNDEFLFLFDRTFSDEFIYADNVWAKELFPQARHPLLYRMYFEYSITKALKQWKADLFFSPDGFLSTKSRVPQIPVIHDINFEHRPEDLPKSYANYYRSYFPRFAKKADKIITVSDFSKNDISNSYSIESSKIHVAHNGYNPAYRQLSGVEKTEARGRFADNKPYFIFVGNFSYRKNIHGIVQAYDEYRRSGGMSKFVFVGNPLWHYTEMDNALAKSMYADDIVFPGRLEINDLVLALGGAQALVFPSYFEGFGIPVLEAFAAGTPVICSNNTSLPEVAGTAALFTNPENIQRLAEHMHTIEKNNLTTERLIQKGLEKKNKFSWDSTANKVKDALFT